MTLISVLLMTSTDIQYSFSFAMTPSYSPFEQLSEFYMDPLESSLKPHHITVASAILQKLINM